MTPFAAQLPSGVTARPLNDRDLAAALTLSAEAGWNQTAADWQIFLDLGSAVGIIGAGGRLIATAATLPHANRFAWISMVLVTAAQQRKGLARWLLRDCIERLTSRQLVPVLDATPAGRSVYSGLGFRDAWSMRRLVGLVGGERRSRRGRGRRQRASRYAGSTRRIGPKSSPMTPRSSAPTAARCCAGSPGVCPQRR